MRDVVPVVGSPPAGIERWLKRKHFSWPASPTKLCLCLGHLSIPAGARFGYAPGSRDSQEAAQEHVYWSSSSRSFKQSRVM